MQRGGIKRGNQWTVRFAINNPGNCRYNETFSPLEKGNGYNSRALLWYQGMQNRNDEDITSAYLKLINEEEYHKRPKFVLWMDNCSSQNKHWTLFSVLVANTSHVLPRNNKLNIFRTWANLYVCRQFPCPG